MRALAPLPSLFIVCDEFSEMLTARQHQLAAFEMVEQPARGRDEHIDATVELAVLVVERYAPDEERHAELVILPVALEALGNLRRSWRVGSRISVRGIRAFARPRARISIIGRVNEAVLPVPVWAMPMTSRPLRTVGMPWAWIGVGVV